MTSRFPRRLYSSGAEPDPRFSLANERTFLAWIRTSLALVAAGIALEALVLDMNPGIRLAAAALFVGLGLLSVVHAWLSWAQTEFALRVNRALPGAAVRGIVALGLVCAIVLVGAGFLLQ